MWWWSRRSAGWLYISVLVPVPHFCLCSQNNRCYFHHACSGDNDACGAQLCCWGCEVEGRAKGVKFHRRARPCSKEFTLQRDSLPSSTSHQLLKQFSAFRVFRGPWQKTRVNAFRPRDWETCKNEVGGETQEIYLNLIKMPARDKEGWLSAHSMFIQLFRKTSLCEAKKGPQLSVGQTWSGHTVVWDSFFLLKPRFQPVILRCPLSCHTVCWALISFLQLPLEGTCSRPGIWLTIWGLELLWSASA